MQSDSCAWSPAPQVLDFTNFQIATAATHVTPYAVARNSHMVARMHPLNAPSSPSPRAVSNRTNATDRVRLPATVLRSSAPGYLLAVGAALALGGFMAWKVVGQADSIHRAETETPAEARAGSAPPAAQPVLVAVAPDDTNTVVRPLSRLATTGATVPAPIVAAAPPANAKAQAVAPLAPVAPAVMPPGAIVAAQRASSESRTSTPHRRAHAAPARSPTNDDNPYDDDSTSPPKNPKPASGSDGTFDAPQ